MDGSKRHRGWVLAGAVVTVLMAVGAAYATGLVSNAQINACAKKSSGALRLQGSGECRASEQAVAWAVTGPQGPAGPPGAQGPPGPSYSLSLSYPSATFQNPAADQYGHTGLDSGEAACGNGKKVLGGGVRTESGAQHVNGSYPSDGSGSFAPGQAGWTGTVGNGGTLNRQFVVYAICVTP